MAKILPIKLTDLHINTDNYRFEPVSSQKEAIDKMINDQGDKLFYLAEHIIANGLNPNDRVQVAVSSHDPSKYNVLEGNRRVVTLKITNNPDLIDGGFLTLKKRFVKLHEENRTKIIKTIDCTVYDDPKDADVWIGIKHGYGKNGTMTNEWDPIQKGRFEEKTEGKSSIVLQTIKLLQSSTEVPSDIKRNIGNLKVTNLDRLISDPEVREFLGMEINNGIIQSSIEKKEVIKGLTHIVRLLLESSFKVSMIYNKDDRRDFLKNFPKNSKPNISLKAEKPWQFNNTPSKLVESISKPSIIPKDRDILIPKKTCKMEINNTKINALYQELQKLSLAKYINVVAISFRVFIELSMDCFIEAKSMTTRKDGRPLGKKDKLVTKVSEVANYLETNDLADKKMCKGIRSAVNNPNDLLGIETLNAYVHNEKFTAIATNLVTSWDNIQHFIEIVWKNIK